jgi:hypothetical protein
MKSVLFRLSFPLAFLFACFTAHLYFPSDILSVRVTWPLISIRIIQLFIASGFLAGARAIGTFLLRYFRFKPTGWGVELGLSTALGLPALAILVHLLSALGLFHFWPLVILCSGLCYLSYSQVVNDLYFFCTRLWQTSKFEKVVLVFCFFVFLPVFLRVCLPLYTGDELTNYLPLIRGMVEKEALVPIDWVQMFGTFPTSGFGLLATLYSLGGDGTCAYFSFGLLMMIFPILYSFGKEFGRFRQPVLSLLLFAVWSQIFLVGRVDSPAVFAVGGIGWAKLHIITTFYLFASGVALVLFVESPGLATGLCLAWVAGFLGGLQIFGIVFDVLDKTKVTDQAREAAVADALRRANLIAKASGVKLGKVHTINEGNVYSPRYNEASALRSADVTPVAKGEQTFRVNVNLVILLAD